MIHQTRYRMLLAAALFSLVGELPIVFLTVSPNLASSYPATIGFIIITFTMFALVPICGIYAFVQARRELRNIYSHHSTPDEARKIRLITILGASGTIIWLPLAAMVVLSFFTFPDIQSPRDHIINDLNMLAADAYRYRIRPLSKGGGDGTYLGYQIPRTIYVRPRDVWVDTTGGFSYRVIYVYSDSIIFEGRPENERTGAVRVTIDSKGRLTNWRYFGDLE